MMTAPRFWWRPRPSLIARLLQPVSWVYGFVARRRFNSKLTYKARIPVICVGNPTVGGAGKTPTAIALADIVRKEGYSPVFLTRGYGGSMTGPALVDLNTHSSLDCGDEALLLAECAPVVVSADRAAGAVHAERHGNLIIMDDGFQNPSLSKDISLLLVDGNVGWGNGLVLPAGPLRLTLEAQLAKADAVVVTGQDKIKVADQLELLGVSPLSAGFHGSTPKGLTGEKVAAFAGIGRPEKFFDMLESTGATLSAANSYADHHRYSENEARELLDQAAALNATLVTTEKDHVRLRQSSTPGLAELYEKSLTLPVRIEFDDESLKIIRALVIERLRR